MDGKSKTEIATSPWEEALFPRQNTSPERDLDGNDTRRLIIKVAERLFRQIGFQKTTVADIARELHMSPANVYRYFAAKSEINEAVCMDLLGTIEAEAEEIAASRDTATQRIRNLFGSVRNTHFEQYISNRKLYDLVEASIINKCASIRQHNERMIEILEQIIASAPRH